MDTLSIFDRLTISDKVRIRLAALNDCSPQTARCQFMRCCSSANWAMRLAAARPFAGLSELEYCSDRVWASCSCADWLEAFAGHPRIGESGGGWSTQEQSGAAPASLEIREAFARTSREYERKFGYIFIICAAGKSLPEMLVSLEKRLGNSAEKELCLAAEEQRRITRLRLGKLVSE